MSRMMLLSCDGLVMKVVLTPFGACWTPGPTQCCSCAGLDHLDERLLIFFDEEGHRDMEDRYKYDVRDSRGLNENNVSMEDRQSPYVSVGTFPEQCYWTPLHIAAAWGNDDIVNQLLDGGADINAPLTPILRMRHPS
ncbi:hypothetical protein F4802DRAFT_596370 [Xylaria palmicola]|nr:hypothetical protein F4802DRAFT_596370 [Xylaria palmicola]